MSLTKHIGLWVLIIVLMSIVGIPFFGDYATKHANDEIHYLSDIFGEEAGDSVKTRAQETFKNCCYDASEYVLHSFVLDSEGKAPSEFLSSLHNNTWSSVYQIIIRLHIFTEFSLYLIPFVFAALYDALQARNIKANNKQWFSPLKYHYGLHTIIALFGGFLIYLLSPIGIHVLFLIFWFIFLALAMSWTFRNMQPKL